MHLEKLKQKSILGLLISFIFIVLPVGASEYQPLAPIPGTTISSACDPSIENDPNCKVDVVDYIPGVVKIIIQIAGALAIIMIVVGGIQYVTTDAIGGKEEGKAKIKQALEGLILALASFMILQTINPGTLNLELTIKPIDPLPELTAPPTETTTPPGRTPWPDDTAERTQLRGIATINRPGTCRFVGEQACTSVYGLGTARLNGLTALKNACGIQNCSIVITGGTEYWLHENRNTAMSLNNTSHKPEANGGRALDLSRNNNALNSVIRGFPEITGGSSCANGRAYQGPNGAIYVDEVESLAFTGAHWHICF